MSAADKDADDLNKMLESMDDKTKGRFNSLNQQRDQLFDQIVVLVAAARGSDLSSDSAKAEIESDVEEKIEMYDEADHANINGVEFKTEVGKLLGQHHDLSEEIMLILDDHNPFMKATP